MMPTKISGAIKTQQRMDQTSKKPLIAVWFSCGAASAVAAKLTIEKYANTHDILVVNNPIAEEHPDNLRFKSDVEKWLGVQIIEAKNKQYPKCSIVEVFDKRKFMSGVRGAPCTALLKKEARYQLECKHTIDFHVLGFTADEAKRHEAFVRGERSNVLPVLIGTGITKKQCFVILAEAGVAIPQPYLDGLPNANCIGCVKATSPTYWNLIRKKYPEVFVDRAKQSRQIGCKLVVLKGRRIYLDELKSTDKGGRIKSWECGIFCDTK